MRESDWHDLCKREHEQGGEVTGVTLIPRSAQELANEVLSSPEAITFLNDPPEGGPRHVVAGARIRRMLNRSAGPDAWIEVDVDPDAEADTLTVRGADGETRTLVLGAA